MRPQRCNKDIIQDPPTPTPPTPRVQHAQEPNDTPPPSHDVKSPTLFSFQPSKHMMIIIIRSRQSRRSARGPVWLQRTSSQPPSPPAPLASEKFQNRWTSLFKHRHISSGDLGTSWQEASIQNKHPSQSGRVGPSTDDLWVKQFTVIRAKNWESTPKLRDTTEQNCGTQEPRRSTTHSERCKKTGNTPQKLQGTDARESTSHGERFKSTGITHHENKNCP